MRASNKVALVVACSVIVWMAAPTVGVADVNTFTEIADFPVGLNTQHMPEWCWAASLEAVFRYYGIDRSQEQIVMATYGRIVDFPAMSPAQLYNVINGVSFSHLGRVDVSVGAFGYGAPPAALLISELRSRHPVIAWYVNPGGQGGHAVVIFGARYSGPAQSPFVTAIKFWDPWPGNGIREVPAAALAGAMNAYFVIRNASARSDVTQVAAQPAHFCCTPEGTFGPYQPNDVPVGAACHWPTPMGMAVGTACNPNSTGGGSSDPNTGDEDDVDHPPPAHFCCTPAGRFGPYPGNDVPVGASCHWGMAVGTACN